MPTKLFDHMKLTEGEKEFVSNVLRDDLASDTSGLLQMQRAQTLATLRLAKEIEESSSASSKTSTALNYLTGALVFVGLVQAFLLFYYR
jgi:hypothetical protein